MARYRLDRIGGLCGVLAVGLSLAACNSTGGGAGATVAATTTTAPIVNGDIPIATTADVPPGSNEDFIINVGRRVYFTENSAELSDTAKATLDKQATWLQAYPNYKIKIEGFADEKGGPAYNKDLGMKRAQSIQAYLATKGIPGARMRVKSFGSDRLVKKCDDISCWSQNRRGIVVLDTEVDS